MNYAEPTVEPMPSVIGVLANYLPHLVGASAMPKNVRYAEQWPIEEVVFKPSQVRFADETEDDLVANEFRSLATKWRTEIGAESSLTRITGNENYLGVIALGKRVVPLILKDLQKEPAPWFVALRVLTKQPNIGREHPGNFRKIANDWIKWGKDNQYI